MSSRAYITSLGPELVSLILELVDDASPRSTRAAACVNKYFNQITRSISHRHKTTEVNGWLNDDKIIESWNTPDVLPYIRTLTVKGWIDPELVLPDEYIEERDDIDNDDDDVAEEEWDEYMMGKIDDEVLWRPLVALILNIGRLRRFDWNVKYPLPVSVLKALQQQQPFSTIRIFNFTRRSRATRELEPVESLLASSPALTHIRQVCERACANRPDFREMALRSIVASAPKLEYAGLIQRHYSDPSSDTRTEVAAYTSVFYQHQKPSTSVRQLTLDGMEISTATLGDWSSIVDLNFVENVKFSRGIPTLDYLKSAASILPNLKHLSLNLRAIKDEYQSVKKNDMIAALQDYIATCSPLQTLSLWSWMDVVPLADLLQRHGQTLTSLQLHEREVATGRERWVLTVEDVRSIRDSCPNLKDFTFDLNRRHPHLVWETDENTEYYKELAKFPKLDSLQLYLDVGESYINTTLALNYNHYRHDYSYDKNSENDQSESESENDQNGQRQQQQPPPPLPSSSATQTVAPTPASNTTTMNSRNDNIETDNKPPPSKKRRRPGNPDRYIRPSRDAAYKTYAKRIWTTIFRHDDRNWGARHLDVKVGEWESRASAHIIEHQLKRHLIVRPNDRDDVEEPTCKMLIARHRRM